MPNALVYFKFAGYNRLSVAFSDRLQDALV